jgi:hypothetical protein
MSGLLSDTERASLGNDVKNIFDTWSRQIIVTKEPQQTILASGIASPNDVFGFGSQQTDPIFSYTPVTGAFQAIIVNPMSFQTPLSPDVNVRVYFGPMIIKVEKACKEFIYNDVPTKHIQVGDKTFLVDGASRRQLFLNGEFFIITLKGIT